MDEDVVGAEVGKVFADNEQGGALAAEHLVAAGHRQLAYVGGPRGLMSARERAEGFRRVAREAGPSVAIAAELYGDYTADHGRAAMTRLLDDHAEVTAVFAASDEILIGMLEVMRGRGLRAGVRLSVITFDDAEPLGLLDPPITAIRQPIDAMGRAAIALIMRAGNEPERAATVRIPVELIVRGSVGPPPGDVRARKAGRRRAGKREISK
jgi:LacI family transcriptional regulator